MMTSKIIRLLKKNKKIKWTPMEKDILSKKSLDTVLHVISFLKQVFYDPEFGSHSRNCIIVEKVISLLKKGRTDKLWKYLRSETVGDISEALWMFLQTLPSPLIPKRIQNLIVADNPGISEHTIARDALGLIKQNVTHNHRILLFALLDMFDFHLKHSNCTELVASSIPFETLPAMFNLEVEATDWKRFAAILQELASNVKWLDDKIGQLAHPPEIGRDTFIQNNLNEQFADGFSYPMLLPLNQVHHGRLHRLFRH